MNSTYSITTNRASLVTSFKLWLNARNYSSLAIQNHINDINIFFDFISKQPTDASPYLSNIISSYIQSIQQEPNYYRQLTHLSKFYQFSFDQKLTTTNPFKKLLKSLQPSLNKISAEYSSYLTKKKYSQTTIRNYLNDIRQFIDWSKSQLASKNI